MHGAFSTRCLEVVAVSLEHKRPMVAFVFVALMCGFLLVNAARGRVVDPDPLPEIRPAVATPGAGVGSSEPPSPAPSAEPSGNSSR